MENEVSVYKPSYVIRLFDDEQIKIDGDRYSKIEKVLLDTDVKFIKIGDKIINSNQIKDITKAKQPKKFPYTN